MYHEYYIDVTFLIMEILPVISALNNKVLLQKPGTCNK